MTWLLLGMLLFTVLYGPQLWVQRVLAQYHRQPEENFPGTGGELARHLLDRFELQAVKVEATEQGDHYDPITRTVRLTPDKLDGRTLTAITVAAHECGHALQHAADEPLFAWRTRLVRAAVIAERLGSFLLFAAPVLVVVTRIPNPALISVAGAFLMMGFGILAQLLTLPVELDASFGKALPLLASGYLEEDQLPAARRILRAAAWTYVAAAFASVFNFWRWLAILKR